MVVPTEDSILEILEDVYDPEVPALNIVELGIVRNVATGSEGNIRVSLVPTYTGCPAMNVIEQLVKKQLEDAGLANAEVRTLYHEVWTTDWMTPEAHEKLRIYGIAPPGKTVDPEYVPACPYCGSEDTKMTSYFGSTACKSMHFCKACVQPFEHFKCH